MSKGILGVFFEDETPAARNTADEAPPPAPSPQPAAAPAFSMPTQLSPQDQDRMHQLEQQMYATQSAYVVFKRVRDAMPQGLALDQVFAIVSAANPTVTKDAVLQAIDSHLGFMARQQQTVEAAATAARNDISALATRIKDLQAEIASRQTDLDTKTRTLGDGMARFQIIFDQLTGPLKQAQQMLGGGTP